MGMIYADIELINYLDVVDAHKYRISEDEIKRMNVNILVDTGSVQLCINENIQEILELPLIEQRRSGLTNGMREIYPVVGPVLIKFKNRTSLTSAIVLPGDCEPLLGAIPMEEMDVIIHPLTQTLDVHPDHPDMATLSLKRIIPQPQTTYN